MRGFIVIESVVALLVIIAIGIIYLGYTVSPSKNEKITGETHTSINMPHKLILKTKRIIFYKSKVSWNFCKPEIALKKKSQINIKSYKMRVYIDINDVLRSATSTKENGDYISEEYNIINTIKNNLQNKTEKYNLCVKELSVARINEESYNKTFKKDAPGVAPFN